MNYYYLYFSIVLFFGIKGIPTQELGKKIKNEEENTKKSMLKENAVTLKQNISNVILKNIMEKEMQEIEKTVQNLLFHHKVILFSKTHCIFSKRAKEILSKYDLKEYEIVELDLIDHGPKYLKALKKLSGIHTVPQLFIDGEFIGDARKIISKDASGTLKEILQGANVLFDKLKHRN
ncbi:Glutaredoxin-1 [Strongyloides ratti]|uniref:Glutaredoxin-1 n=1 Tax=Strongyloides ratti TaxID=34506 RepID=A0A090KTJ7_STRRB|nr:Glutaredoxin-1 [Strongyloides ratti]CEF60696.1 Glutaredoxin-1 [Strongyloides ratti]